MAGKTNEMTPYEIQAHCSKNPTTVQANAAAARLAIEHTWNAGLNPEGIAPVIEALKYYKAICGNTGYGVDPENARIAYDLAMKALDAITIKPKNEE